MLVLATYLKIEGGAYKGGQFYKLNFAVAYTRINNQDVSLCKMCFLNFHSIHWLKVFLQLDIYTKWALNGLEQMFHFKLILEFALFCKSSLLPVMLMKPQAMLFCIPEISIFYYKER